MPIPDVAPVTTRQRTESNVYHFIFLSISLLLVVITIITVKRKIRLKLPHLYQTNYNMKSENKKCDHYHQVKMDVYLNESLIYDDMLDFFM